MDLISIIIPCFNQGKYLKECIDSLKSQTHTCWEALIVNDGSTDDTLSICKKLIDQDNRVRLINKKNGGLSSARNAGIEAAAGKFFQFLDSDDLLFPDKLRFSLNLINEHDADIAVTSYSKTSAPTFDPPFNTVLPLSLTIPPDVYSVAADWETRSSIPAHCFLFRREVFDGIRFDTSLPNHEDWDCWIRILYNKPKVAMASNVLAIYRVHPQSMCADISTMKNGFLAAIDKHLNSKEATLGIHAVLRAKRAEMELRYALMAQQASSASNTKVKFYIKKLRKFAISKLIRLH